MNSFPFCNGDAEQIYAVKKSVAENEGREGPARNIGHF